MRVCSHHRSCNRRHASCRCVHLSGCLVVVPCPCVVLCPLSPCPLSPSPVPCPCVAHRLVVWLSGCLDVWLQAEAAAGGAGGSQAAQPSAGSKKAKKAKSTEQQRLPTADAEGNLEVQMTEAQLYSTVVQMFASYQKVTGVMGRWGDGAIWGDGRWGDRVMGRWGDGVMG